MNILIVSRSSTGHTGSGGMERHYESLVRHLIDRGDDVCLLTTPFGKGEGQQVLPAYRSIRNTRSGNPGRYSLQWWLQSRAEAKKFGIPFDVIMSISSAGMSLLSSSESVVVGQCHGTALAELQSAGRAFFSKPAYSFPRIILNLARIPRDVFAYRRFRLVVAISESVADQLFSWPYKISSDSVRIIRNGVDVGLFQGALRSERFKIRELLGVTQSDSVGFYAGRLAYQKGADMLVRALAEAPSRRHLIVCGEGPERRRLEALAVRLFVNDKVTFTGAIDKQCVARYLAAADVAFLPSRRTEGLSLSLLESVASGLPVAVTAHVKAPDDLIYWTRSIEPDPAEISRVWATGSGRTQIKEVIPRHYHNEVSLEQYCLFLREVSTGV